jgi:multimeric flavodoxin WrbA
VEECENELNRLGNEVEHICMNKKNVQKCNACGKRGWGICSERHVCIQKDDFNGIYKNMNDFDAYIFITPVFFHEMSESAKAFFDRLKRCDAFYDDSKIKGKKIVCIACAGGSGTGTEETLKSFDTLSYFLKTEMVGRIPVTKFNFEEQKEEIKKCCSELT